MRSGKTYRHGPRTFSDLHNRHLDEIFAKLQACIMVLAAAGNSLALRPGRERTPTRRLGVSFFHD